MLTKQKAIELEVDTYSVIIEEMIRQSKHLLTLLNDWVRLQALYPRGNAEHINEQQKDVLEHWTALQKRVVMCKSAFEQSYQLQALNKTVRDLKL